MSLVELISGLGFGGAERALVQRLRATADLARPLVISTRPELNALSAEVRALTDLVEIPLGRLQVKEVVDIVREVSPEAVIAHNPLEVLRLLNPAQMRLLPPVVPVAHSDRTTFRHGANHLLRTSLYAANLRAAGHIAVSKAAAVGEQCRGSRRVEIAHLGSDVNLQAQPFDPWPVGTQLRLLALGRFVAPKNLQTLVLAVCDAELLLRSAGAHLLLVGHGPEERMLKNLIADLELGTVVSVCSPVADPSGLLQVADAVIVASSHEGGPLTAYEAMQMGVRIVGTPVGVLPELLASDTASILLGDDSKESLKRGLTEIVAAGPLQFIERALRQERNVRWAAGPCSDEFYEALRRILA